MLQSHIIVYLFVRNNEKIRLFFTKSRVMKHYNNVLIIYKLQVCKSFTQLSSEFRSAIQRKAVLLRSIFNPMKILHENVT